MSKKDNGVVFVVGISLEDLEKPFLQGGFISTFEDGKVLKTYDYMDVIEIETYTDFYTKNNVLRFAGMHWNIHQLENYSNVGNFIVYISKDKGKAIEKIAKLYSTIPQSRGHILKDGYFND